jgi:hypothetical protein
MAADTAMGCLLHRLWGWVSLPRNRLLICFHPGINSYNHGQAFGPTHSLSHTVQHLSGSHASMPYTSNNLDDKLVRAFDQRLKNALLGLG